MAAASASMLGVEGGSTTSARASSGRTRAAGSVHERHTMVERAAQPRLPTPKVVVRRVSRPVRRPRSTSITRSSSSSSTRSARSPGCDRADLVLEPEHPGRRGGGHAGRRRPCCTPLWTTRRRAASMVSGAAGDRAVVAASRATPSATVTVLPAQLVARRRACPAAAIASVIRATRSGAGGPDDVAQHPVVQVHAVGDLLADHARRVEQGHDRARVAVVDRAHAVARGGCRRVAPASIAGHGSARTWRRCARSPRPPRGRAAARSRPGRRAAPGRSSPSGRRRGRAARPARRVRVAQVGRVLRAAAGGDRYGPSKCTPASTPVGDQRARTRWSRRAASASGAVTRLASRVVVPWPGVEGGRRPGLRRGRRW